LRILGRCHAIVEPDLADHVPEQPPDVGEADAAVVLNDERPVVVVELVDDQEASPSGIHSGGPRARCTSRCYAVHHERGIATALAPCRIKQHPRAPAPPPPPCCT